MLLKCLYEYAHKRELLDDPAFSKKAVRWLIQLDRDCDLIGSGPMDLSEDGKRGQEFLAPLTSRPKVAGGIAEFLADGITALFGLDMDPEKDRDNARRRKDRDANNTAKYRDFWRQIEQADVDTHHPALSALLKLRYSLSEQPSFLSWKATEVYEKPAWWLTTASGEEIKLKPDNFTFNVENQLLLNDEVLREWWRKTYQQEVGMRETQSDT